MNKALNIGRLFILYSQLIRKKDDYCQSIIHDSFIFRRFFLYMKLKSQKWPYTIG